MSTMKPCKASRRQKWSLNSKQQSQRMRLLHLSSNLLDKALPEELVLGLVLSHGLRNRWEVAEFTLAIGSLGGSKLRWGASEAEDTGSFSPVPAMFCRLTRRLPPVPTRVALLAVFRSWLISSLLN